MSKLLRFSISKLQSVDFFLYSDEDSIEALATQHLAGRASSTPIKVRTSQECSKCCIVNCDVSFMLKLITRRKGESYTIDLEIFVL